MVRTKVSKVKVRKRNRAKKKPVINLVSPEKPVVSSPPQKRATPPEHFDEFVPLDEVSEYVTCN